MQRNKTGPDQSAGPVITVGLIGNPNCGKTTLFNRLAQAKALVGNYPRVTVEMQEKQFTHQGVSIRLVDLPGVYALTSKSPEERSSREFLYSEEADVLVNILDAGNLERSLFLTTQLLEMGQPTVYALNMMDEARQRGIAIDTGNLQAMLNGPVVEMVSTRGEGLEALLDAILELARIPHGTTRPIFIPYDAHVESAILGACEQIRKLHPREMDQHQVRWLAIKLLEGDDEFLQREEEHDHLQEMIRRARYDLARDHGESCEMLLAHARYGFIHGLVSEVISQRDDPALRWKLTRTLDNLFLHPTLGLPLFLFLMWLMFEATFSLGAIPAGWIDTLVQQALAFGTTLLPGGLVRDLILEGILTGVGAVIVFLPYILILFFFIAIFSETGYLARSSFLLDRLMHFFGLHGKAFIPLVMGFGCNVPAVMATRTIENPLARRIAILVNPFISCAQRLPAYILLTGAFFPERASWIIFIVYSTSIGSAMLASVFLSRVVFRGNSASFVMELPPFRIPTWRSVLLHMWEKAWEFVRMVGGVIVVGSIIIWFLQAFPQQKELEPFFGSQKTALEARLPAGPERDQALAELARRQKQQRLENSYLALVGQTISPVFVPLGFDWKDTVAILSGFFAKEVVVASYAVLYGQEEGEGSEGLRQALTQAMTPVTAFTLMIFLLLYAPCLSTMAAIRREAGWGYAAFSVLFSFGVAYGMAFTLGTVAGWVL
ncbi:MAG: ferrous iron transport protein B [Magnetococcales bacterium]|nr:ferrous iron transport protein B [Magnetococcales bacterium]